MPLPEIDCPARLRIGLFDYTCTEIVGVSVMPSMDALDPNPNATTRTELRVAEQLGTRVLNQRATIIVAGGLVVEGIVDSVRGSSGTIVSVVGRRAPAPLQPTKLPAQPMKKTVWEWLRNPAL